MYFRKLWKSPEWRNSNRLKLLMKKMENFILRDILSFEKVYYFAKISYEASNKFIDQSHKSQRQTSGEDTRTRRLHGQKGGLQPEGAYIRDKSNTALRNLTMKLLEERKIWEFGRWIHRPKLKNQNIFDSPCQILNFFFFQVLHCSNFIILVATCLL